MNRDELDALITAYNAAELEQKNRLEALYRSLRDRHSSTRRIEFSNGEVWSANTFQPMEEKLSLPRFVGAMTRFIKKYNLGEE